ncbi:hypothetical protein FZO89_09810 [Luteimonas viscosa]|uniref:Uncharacterized protein n=1 Tax=Luteimonas viscosa TaxID=1132694 RepID=A0A5D4XRZ3_9GAMM|nr:hypothetical protein [Luteimonas viscosa]TYT26531.1 hypothetical protein FZO89_09810 [Luteimonas viscosa]
MNRTRLSQALLAAAIGSVALIGCKKEEPAPTPPAAPAETTPAPAPVPPPAAPASSASVTLGNAIDANNTIATPLTTFAAGDTIHASVATDGAAPGQLTAKWTHLDSSQTVAEETKDIAAGPQVTDFHISKPDGWPTGRYQVEVSMDGAVVNTSEFTVQ